MKCPKCGYERTPADDLQAPSSECPVCGVVYAKFVQARAGTAAKPASDRPNAPQNVVVTGVDIPFFDLVNLIFKASLAAIPAMLLLAGVGLGLSFILALLGVFVGR